MTIKILLLSLCVMMFAPAEEEQQLTRQYEQFIKLQEQLSLNPDNPKLLGEIEVLFTRMYEVKLDQLSLNPDNPKLLGEIEVLFARIYSVIKTQEHKQYYDQLLELQRQLLDAQSVQLRMQIHEELKKKLRSTFKLDLSVLPPKPTYQLQPDNTWLERHALRQEAGGLGQVQPQGTNIQDPPVVSPEVERRGRPTVYPSVEKSTIDRADQAEFKQTTQNEANTRSVFSPSIMAMQDGSGVPVPSPLAAEEEQSERGVPVPSPLAAEEEQSGRGVPVSSPLAAGGEQDGKGEGSGSYDELLPSQIGGKIIKLEKETGSGGGMIPDPASVDESNSVYFVPQQNEFTVPLSGHIPLPSGNGQYTGQVQGQVDANMQAKIDTRPDVWYTSSIGRIKLEYTRYKNIMFNPRARYYMQYDIDNAQWIFCIQYYYRNNWSVLPVLNQNSYGYDVIYDSSDIYKQGIWNPHEQQLYLVKYDDSSKQFYIIMPSGRLVDTKMNSDRSMHMIYDNRSQRWIDFAPIVDLGRYRDIEPEIKVAAVAAAAAVAGEGEDGVVREDRVVGAAAAGGGVMVRGDGGVSSAGGGGVAGAGRSGGVSSAGVGGVAGAGRGGVAGAGRGGVAGAAAAGGRVMARGGAAAASGGAAAASGGAAAASGDGVVRKRGVKFASYADVAYNLIAGSIVKLDDRTLLKDTAKKSKHHATQESQSRQRTTSADTSDDEGFTPTQADTEALEKYLQTRQLEDAAREAYEQEQAKRARHLDRLHKIMPGISGKLVQVASTTEYSKITELENNIVSLFNTINSIQKDLQKMTREAAKQIIELKAINKMPLQLTAQQQYIVLEWQLIEGMLSASMQVKRDIKKYQQAIEVFFSTNDVADTALRSFQQSLARELQRKSIQQQIIILKAKLEELSKQVSAQTKAINAQKTIIINYIELLQKLQNAQNKLTTMESTQSPVVKEHVTKALEDEVIIEKSLFDKDKKRFTTMIRSLLPAEKISILDIIARSEYNEQLIELMLNLNDDTDVYNQTTRPQKYKNILTIIEAFITQVTNGQLEINQIQWQFIPSEIQESLSELREKYMDLISKQKKLDELIESYMESEAKYAKEIAALLASEQSSILGARMMGGIAGTASVVSSETSDEDSIPRAIPYASFIEGVGGASAAGSGGGSRGGVMAGPAGGASAAGSRGGVMAGPAGGAGGGAVAVSARGGAVVVGTRGGPRGGASATGPRGAVTGGSGGVVAGGPSGGMVAGPRGAVAAGPAGGPRGGAVAAGTGGSAGGAAAAAVLVESDRVLAVQRAIYTHSTTKPSVLIHASGTLLERVPVDLRAQVIQLEDSAIFMRNQLRQLLTLINYLNNQPNTELIKIERETAKYQTLFAELKTIQEEYNKLEEQYPVQ